MGLAVVAGYVLAAGLALYLLGVTAYEVLRNRLAHEHVFVELHVREIPDQAVRRTVDVCSKCPAVRMNDVPL